ncbi:MAG: NUDIX hydrolase [Patescibacteria group bacterium]|mgnify:CR=1 FL=1
MQKNQNFHVGLKAFINKNDKLLILREPDRGNDFGKWGLPGGRIQEAESNTPLDNVLKREIFEECGRITVKIGDIEGVWRSRSRGGVSVFLIGFKCNYVNGDVILNEEHVEHKWIAKDEAGKYTFASGYKEAIDSYFLKK